MRDHFYCTVHLLKLAPLKNTKICILILCQLEKRKKGFSSAFKRLVSVTSRSVLSWEISFYVCFTAWILGLLDFSYLLQGTISGPERKNLLASTKLYLDVCPVPQSHSIIPLKNYVGMLVLHNHSMTLHGCGYRFYPL